MKLVLLLSIFVFNLYSLSFVDVDEHTKQVNLSHYTDVLYDAEHKYEYADVVSEQVGSQFRPVISDSISPGYTSDVIWLRFKINNPQSKPFLGTIELPIPWINNLDVYIKSNDRLSIKEYGSNFEFNKREIDSRSFLIPIEIDPKSSMSVYIKAHGKYSVILAPYLYSKKEISYRQTFITQSTAILVAIIIVMIIYNLFIFLKLRDYNYLRYTFYLISIFFLMGAYYGYNLKWLWLPDINNMISPTIISASLFFGLLFARHFLNTSSITPKIDIFLRILMYTYFIIAILNFFVSDHFTLENIAVFLATFYSIGLILVSFIAWRKDVPGSGYFVIAWSVSMIGALLSSLLVQGDLYYNHLLYEAYGIAIIIDIIFLSFALVSRIEHIKKENEKIQVQIIENERVLLNHLNHSNFKLEKRISAEVEKNKIQQQKMFEQTRLAQMGEMISMIAHQWRQPLGAIASTAINLKMKLELESFNLKEESGRKECEKYFDNSLNDISKFVTNLTTTIDDFRNFYKPNKKSTNTTLESVVKRSIQVIKTSLHANNISLQEDYNSKIMIDIYENEMLQVVLNIIKNAQDNFKDQNIKNPIINIKSYDTDNSAVLEISDNGGGIPEDIIENIFDPYFSTKSEKNGTGLGLYMSRVIVSEHHKGEIYAKNINDGVCFVIKLNRDN